MNVQSDFFSPARFGRYLNLRAAEQLRPMLLVGAVGFGVLLICFFCLTMESYAYLASNPESLGHSVRYGWSLDGGEGKAIFLIAAYAVTVFAATFSLQQLKKREERLHFFLLPASRFEKYLGSLAAVLACWGLFLLVFTAADLVCLTVAKAAYPPLASLLNPSLLTISWERHRYIIMGNGAAMLFLLSSIRFGTLVWPRHSLLLTLGTLFLLGLGALWAIQWMDDAWFPSGYFYPRAASLGYIDETPWLLGGSACWTLFLEGLIYFRLGETEVVNRRLF